MHAYLFWHQPAADVDPNVYEQRLVHFHQRLGAHPTDGLARSFVVRHDGLPWIATAGPVYEDWYLVESFAALELLDRGAVESPRKDAHDRSAELAGDGAGGLYCLAHGAPQVVAPLHETWVSKPRGESYQLFRSALSATLGVECIWTRQMVLGPGPEFCLFSHEPLAPAVGENVRVFHGTMVYSASSAPTSR